MIQKKFLFLALVAMLFSQAEPSDCNMRTIFVKLFLFWTCGSGDFI